MLVLRHLNIYIKFFLSKLNYLYTKVYNLKNLITFSFHKFVMCTHLKTNVICHQLSLTI